ncbi:MAG: YtxH domain-containing protein [Anaerolineae bacterium]|nr:YtxH domain-containing protein [Anaerolineae bacterium]
MLRQVSSVVVGLACGAAVSSVLVLFLTPDSGENLRKRSRRWYDQLMLESAQAAESRREILRAELQSKIAAQN